MGNLSAVTFTANGTFTPPGGVTQVTVVSKPSIVTTFSGNAGMAFLDSFGNALATGDNTNGQLGAGISPGTSAAVSSPVLVVGGLNFIQLAQQAVNVSGDAFRAGLTNQGKIYSWGQNNSGQLGDGTITTRSSPVLVVGGLSFVSVYSGGLGTAAGITAAGQLYMWGSNNRGQLGNSATANTSSPVLVTGTQSFSQVYISCDPSVLALNTSGTPYAWGFNSFGQLGVGDVTPRSAPVAVLGSHTFTSIATITGASQNSCFLALDTAGAAWAWGKNNNGQLGNGNTTNQSSPVAVLGGLVFKQLWMGQDGSNNRTSCFGLTAAGVLYAWGGNANGQLGLGDTNPRSSPVAVLGGLSFANIVVACSTTTTIVGLTTTGLAYSWGDNTSGALGQNVTPGTSAGVSSPVAVVGGLTFTQLGYVDGGGFTNTIWGMSNTGALYGWGDNENGQIGDTTSTSRSSPVLVFAGAGLPANSFNTTTVIPVTPGTSYAINITQPNPMFGTTSLGILTPLSVTVYFEE